MLIIICICIVYVYTAIHTSSVTSIFRTIDDFPFPHGASFSKTAFADQQGICQAQCHGGVICPPVEVVRKWLEHLVGKYHWKISLDIVKYG